MLIFSFFLFLVCAAENPLKFVAVIIRHGARSPLTNLTELKDKCSWPTGLGELTPSGQRQHFLLGSLLRKKYITTEKLLSPTYDSSEVYFRSTHTHRTVMSTESLAFGLYPDGLSLLNDQQLGRREVWMPPIPQTTLNVSEKVITTLGKSGMPFNVSSIPVTSFTKINDRLLMFESCPRYIQYRSAYYASESYNKTYDKYKKHLYEACDMFHINCKASPHTKAFFYADYFLASEFDNQLPQLTKKPDLVDQLLRLYSEIMAGEMSMDPIMNNIAMHDFAKVFEDYFENAISGKAKTKMVVYGTHDSTLVAYLIALAVDKKYYEKIPYASNIIMELRQNAEGKHDVHFIYNGDEIFKKDKDVFLKEIKELGKLNGKWEDVCKLATNAEVSKGQVLSSSVATVFLAASVLVGVMGLSIFYVRKKRSNNNHLLTL
eukprot:TRINITY_DN6080_c0_g2_i2.p1 TRINITY_DN6080_c0_g2~~TRINITY_DN6080_c0_g2_i2.p1  ORF type:complete len:432 (+),score=89.49 TRINITY_DN6080_c0_g2_i2:220-1515(+)